MLPPNARVLDLGCGAGVPVATRLAERGCTVVGVDSSQRQIALARMNEPRASFIASDMTMVEFDAMSFDAVIALYSITHVPRDEHQRLLNRIRTWLKPNGLFLSSLGYNDSPAWTGKWLGTTMFFSHFDAVVNRALIKNAGLKIEREEIVGEDENGEITRFLWVIAISAVKPVWEHLTAARHSFFLKAFSGSTTILHQRSLGPQQSSQRA